MKHYCMVVVSTEYYTSITPPRGQYPSNKQHSRSVQAVLPAQVRLELERLALHLAAVDVLAAFEAHVRHAAVAVVRPR